MEDFGDISNLDSIIIVDVTNNKKYKWVRPNDAYGIIDTEKIMEKKRCQKTCIT